MCIIVMDFRLECLNDIMVDPHTHAHTTHSHTHNTHNTLTHTTHTHTHTHTTQQHAPWPPAVNPLSHLNQESQLYPTVMPAHDHQPNLRPSLPYSICTPFHAHKPRTPPHTYTPSCQPPPERTHVHTHITLSLRLISAFPLISAATASAVFA